MRPAALLPACFAVGGLCQLYSKNAVVKNFIDRLSRDINIDWTKPPTFEDGVTTEKAGMPWTLFCSELGFKRRKEIVQARENTAASKAADQPKLSVFYTTYVEKGIMNFGDDDLSFSMEESTTTINSTTEGWQIGAQLSAGTSSVAIGVSGGYSKSWTNGKFSTKGVSIHTTCKSHHDCRFETWTFHLKVTGICKIKPLILCNDEIIDACGPLPHSSTDQTRAYRTKWCLSNGPHRRYRHEPYEVNTPILDQAGMPLTRLARISESFMSDLEAAPTAVQEDDGWYLLSTNEWYDPKDDTYYNPVEKVWFEKKGVPKPDLSKFVKTGASTGTADSSPGRAKTVSSTGTAETAAPTGGAKTKRSVSWGKRTDRPVAIMKKLVEVDFVDNFQL